MQAAQQGSTWKWPVILQHNTTTRSLLLLYIHPAAQLPEVYAEKTTAQKLDMVYAEKDKHTNWIAAGSYAKQCFTQWHTW